MLLKITRSSFDELLYMVGAGSGTRALKAAALRHWLQELGAGDAAITAVLEIPPGESVSVELPDQQDYREGNAKAG